MDHLHVLVIEDEPDDFRAVRDMLHQHGDGTFQIDWVDTFEAGLEALKQRVHDIYLIDSGLRKHSGLDLLREAKKETELPPIILLNRGGTHTLDVTAMELGASAYLDKSRVSSRSLARALRYALQQHRQYAILRQKVLQDELTGLLNRRGIMQVLEDEIARYKRYGGEFSVLLVDIDNFKEVNDAYGHLLGDTVLREIAERIESTVRGVDKVGRYGGDEILVILPETPVDQAKNAAHRIRTSIMKDSFRCNQKDGGVTLIALTATVGGAGMPGDAEDLDALLEAADRALYDGKAAGKNQSILTD